MPRRLDIPADRHRVSQRDAPRLVKTNQVRSVPPSFLRSTLRPTVRTPRGAEEARALFRALFPDPLTP
jgi:hypothetical protein